MKYFVLFYFYSLWCRVKSEHFVFILPGLSAVSFFKVNVFPKIKMNLLYCYCCVWFIYIFLYLKFECCTCIFSYITCRLFHRSVKLSTQFFSPGLTTLQNKSSLIQLDMKHYSNRKKVALLLWRQMAKQEVILWTLLQRWWWKLVESVFWLKGEHLAEEHENVGVDYLDLPEKLLKT